MAKKNNNINRFFIEQEQFNIDYANTAPEDIQKEILFNLQMNNTIAEKTRANTSSLITWLIVIPLLIGLAIIIMTMPTMN